MGKWFNQGLTLLHSFWDYEAGRALRWRLKLEPDNAMAYWGMARATSDKRSSEFIREAAKRKNTVTERERLYIEAMEALVANDALRDRECLHCMKQVARHQRQKVRLGPAGCRGSRGQRQQARRQRKEPQDHQPLRHP